jgi:macrolide-specific efflux system membrane fusion protein
MKTSQKKWLGLGVIVMMALASFAVWKWKKPGKTIYKEYTVERGNLQLNILSTGTVMPENRLEIKAPVAGRIDQVLANEGDVVRKGKVLAWMSSTERAALLDAARARGAEELKRWEEIYKPTPIVAPLPGTIILKNVEPGQTITATDAIFAMSDRLTVKAQVDETDIAKIKLHQKAEILLDAYPDRKIPATVDQIAFEAKTVNNVTTYVVDVLPEKTPDFLRSGMTANVRFQQDERKDILLVSSDAISVSDGKSRVLLKTADGHSEEQEVEIGISDGKRSEVISGLEIGETVLRKEFSISESAKSGSPFSPFGGGRKTPGSQGGRR